MKLIHASALIVTAFATAATAAPMCQSSAAAQPPLIVELYTSEGCSSCPPAERWLSTLKGRGDVIALAFHVNYWDHLGWVDRFASAEATARQYALAHEAGGSTVYTPQVVVNGRDWSAWPRLPAATGNGAVQITLTREADVVTVQVSAGAGAPTRLEGYWAVLEDGYASKVRAGENAGETLHHDDVVRLYQQVPAWVAATGERTQLAVSRGVAENPRRVVFVVSDPATHRPLQAAALGC